MPQLLLALFLLLALPVHAQLSADFGGPGGGSIRIGADPVTTCSAATAGTLRQNGANFVVCNGTNWQYASLQATNGYFVLLDTTYTGNMGGLSGADAICLTRLQNDAWLGKAEAQAVNQLTSSKVKAFLCSSSGCNQAKPNTLYKFARATIPTAGGAEFTTDASGLGPNDSADWSGTAYFGTFESFWTNRASSNTVTWSAAPYSTNTANTCLDFTSAVENSNTLRLGNAHQTNHYRWSYFADTCNNPFRIVCMVHP